jgi:hypothetical protein
VSASGQHTASTSHVAVPTTAALRSRRAAIPTHAAPLPRTIRGTWEWRVFVPTNGTVLNRILALEDAVGRVGSHMCWLQTSRHRVQ